MEKRPGGEGGYWPTWRSAGKGIVAAARPAKKDPIGSMDSGDDTWHTAGHAGKSDPGHSSAHRRQTENQADQRLLIAGPGLAQGMLQLRPRRATLNALCFGKRIKTVAVRQ